MIMREIYGDIFVSDMLKNPIEYQHSELVKKKSKKIIRETYFSLLFTLFISIIMLYFAVMILINNDMSEVIAGVLIMLFFSIIFFCISIRDIKCISYIQKGIKRCQYGTINTKYYVSNSHSESKHRRFYVNVTFEDSLKTLDRIICSQKDYRYISEGDRVLVISYNDKDAHIVLLK